MIFFIKKNPNNISECNKDKNILGTPREKVVISEIAFKIIKVTKKNLWTWRDQGRLKKKKLIKKEKTAKIYRYQSEQDTHTYTDTNTHTHMHMHTLFRA